MSDDDELIANTKRFAWVLVLPVAFLFAAMTFSCGGAVALVIWACK